MARYIDADALIKEHIEKEKGRYGSCLVVGDNRFLQRFLNAPTADVVEVVRCKECKYFVKGILLGTCYKVVSVCGDEIETNPDWFCADGERRDDGEE